MVSLESSNSTDNRIEEKTHIIYNKDYFGVKNG